MAEQIIEQISFDKFSVTVYVGDAATLFMAENYVTIREVFVDDVKVEPNDEKQIFLTSGGDSLWELAEGNIVVPTESRKYTSKTMQEVDVVNGSTDKYLNEKGDFTTPTISHSSTTGKNDETTFQHIDTTTTKQTLVQADKVPIYDSVTGDIVLTDKKNVGLQQVLTDGVTITGDGTPESKVALNILGLNESDNYFVTEFEKEQIEALLVGATIRRANVEEIRNLVAIAPPPEAQSAIVAFLETETAKIDTLVTEAQQAISLLKERRSALISAAVTGKIDVRGTV